MDAFLKWLADLVAVGGTSAAVAFGVFKWLGQKWIDQTLNIQLEAYKAERQKDVEGFKAEQQTVLEASRPNDRKS